MNLQNDKFSFLKFCIPARILLSYTIYETSDKYIKSIEEYNEHIITNIKEYYS